MGASYRVSPRLKQALVKLSALPHHEQDKVAIQIMARLGGDEWTEPSPHSLSRVAFVGETLDRILPKNPVARTLTLVMGSFILFVQAPMVLTLGIGDMLHRANSRPSPAGEIRKYATNGMSHTVVIKGESRHEPNDADIDGPASRPGVNAPDAGVIEGRE